MGASASSHPRDGRVRSGVPLSEHASASSHDEWVKRDADVVWHGFTQMGTYAENTPIVVERVRRSTTLPNAEAAGMGPSRRVIVWDTLVDGRFTERELEVVVAHELGHLARHHIWKDVGWYALFAFPGAWAIARATRRRGGMSLPPAVPLALLVLVVLNYLALPLQNAISRHMEAEADWMALRTTRDPAAAIGLFRRFVPTTLEEPDPSTFDYLLRENHPTLVQRIGMAEAYATSAAQSP